MHGESWRRKTKACQLQLRLYSIKYFAEKKARSRSPDSDRGEDASPQRRKQKKKATNDAVPRWQRDKNLLRLVSSTSPLRVILTTDR